MVKCDPEMKRFIDGMDIAEPLNPRHAFYGGRTHAARLYAKVGEGGVIRYCDFVSLYPTINKLGKMPVGHPILVTPDTYTKAKYFGLIKETVRPPRGLLVSPCPSIPCKGKTTLPLVSDVCGSQAPG